MNKEIDDKILEIIDYIKNTDYYKNYLKAKELLNLDNELIKLIEDIKKYQKEIVKNPSKREELEDKIKKNLDILNTNPLYLDYINNLDEVNNMLIIFENKLNKYLYDVFN